MDTRRNNVAQRLMRLLAAGAAGLAGVALSGCVAYGPPYAGVYDAAPVAAAPYYAPNYSPYYSPYYYPYAYGRPAYVGPPVSLNFGYYEHRYRGGGPNWHSGPRWRGGGGHGWNNSRSSGPRWGGGARGPGGHGGYRGGGRGHR